MTPERFITEYYPDEDEYNGALSCGFTLSYDMEEEYYEEEDEDEE